MNKPKFKTGDLVVYDNKSATIVDCVDFGEEPYFYWIHLGEGSESDIELVWEDELQFNIIEMMKRTKNETA